MKLLFLLILLLIKNNITIRNTKVYLYHNQHQKCLHQIKLFLVLYSKKLNRILCVLFCTVLQW
jgi:hypothetical protein